MICLPLRQEQLQSAVKNKTDKLALAMSEPSEAVSDHTSQLLLAQYWLICPLTPGLQGPVTPAIVWPGPILTCTQQSLVINSGLAAPRPQPCSPRSLSGMKWSGADKHGTTFINLKPITAANKSPLPPEEDREWELFTDNTETAYCHLLLGKHRCVRCNG